MRFPAPARDPPQAEQPGAEKEQRRWLGDGARAGRGSGSGYVDLKPRHIAIIVDVKYQRI